MKSSTLLLGFAGLLTIACLPINAAHAQALSRTWVSGTGNDLNDCTREAPCRTFPGAISKTANDGEINCIDSGGYSAVTITKSLTIDCAGSMGSIVSSGTNGIVVSSTIAAPGRVVLRNLVIQGAGSGLSGIVFNGGTKLEVDNVKFEGFTGVGIGSTTRNTSAILIVRNSSFSEMPTGIKLQTTSGNVIVTVENTSFNNLSTNGVEAGQSVYAGVFNSTFSALNGTAILAATASSTVYAENNIIQNTNVGISAVVAGGKINANGNTFYGNSKAFNVVAGAAFLSGGGNKYDINPGNPATGSLGWK